MHNPSAPVVVLTGASSGIGRATAQLLARQGANLVLAARGRQALQTVAAECQREGGLVETVPTDVTDAAAVRALARAAIERFGHFDVWINNVGVGAVGRFEETPIEAHRRVIETNLIGHMNGAHVAIPHFRHRQRGILINMISIGGWLSAPYAGAYTASKFALRGLGQSLRAELSDVPDIHVCDVYPAFVDTPGVSHGANFTGHRLRPVPPLLNARTVARRVAALVHNPRPVTAIGSVAHAARFTHTFAPHLRGRVTKRLADAALSRADPASASAGNLFATSAGHEIDGGFRRPAVTVGLGVLAVGVLGLALRTFVHR
jgi:short-subunit dehydrogenase